MKTAYINGKVYTGDLDLQQAFIVENGKFGLVGANEDVLAQSPTRLLTSRAVSSVPASMTATCMF